MALKDKSLFRQAALVGGRWIEADRDKSIEVTNPATGALIGRVPRLGTAETREAIEAAKSAMAAWAGRTAKERSQLLRHWYDLIVENKDDLGEILTLEQGKPLAEARAEILYGASFVEWFAEEARRNYGDIVPGHQRDKRILVIKQPIGVVAAITPWNFPNAMITRKVAPALGAGCGVVLKPASQTPFSAIALAVLAERAGIPPELFSVLTGPAKDIGGELTANSCVRKVTFTGSTKVGAELMRQSAGTIKKMGLELGAMPHSLYSTMRTSMRPSKGRLSRNFATMGRPVFALTGSTCRTASSMPMPRSSALPSPLSRLATAWSPTLCLVH